ncbi:TFIIB-type zinc ribbon-containing protein [Stieleria varia]|uniref:Transcription factor zinc-finger domain-containing protein n=1 Tax=Stieleria varia TaxID=2528005 RepID=A0A5C6AYA6_9BACT|nr:zf-TFIIB domain-containing protein [Stieleria varia]TWU04700.1 hypothetical protein Pla52n_27420 [Stieleria varia]
MQCPECSTEKLVTKSLRPSKVAIDVCPSCHGAWFDADEMPDVLSVATADLAPPSDSRPSLRMCPKGCHRMRAFHYPQTDVLIDMCPQCKGLWLDHGEFSEIREVRRQLEAAGKLEETQGTSGSLMGWVFSAIKALTDSR